MKKSDRLLPENLFKRIQFLENRVSELENKADTEIIGVKEVCEWLNLKERTVYLKISNKSIPFYKDGKKVYFKRSEIINNMERIIV